MIFILFIAFIILTRLAELMYSRNNEKWLLAQGAVESGQTHYPYIVALHILFVVSLLAEASLKPTLVFIPMIFVIYLMLLAFKIWVIRSLGKFWNTKIYHLPNVPAIRTGPYRYFKHPNYLVVAFELVLIPLSFQLYYTAVIFSILNAMMLYVRIKEENKVLQL